ARARGRRLPRVAHVLAAAAGGQGALLARVLPRERDHAAASRRRARRVGHREADLARRAAAGRRPALGHDGDPRRFVAVRRLRRGVHRLSLAARAPSAPLPRGLLGGGRVVPPPRQRVAAGVEGPRERDREMNAIAPAASRASVRLAAYGDWLRDHAGVVRAVQWIVVAAYLILLAVPAWLPLPGQDAHALDNFT